MQTRKLRKGDIVEARCADLVSEGLGLSHISVPEGEYKPLTGFVWGVLPGERFLAEVKKSKSGHFHGVLLDRARFEELFVGRGDWIGRGGSGELVQFQHPKFAIFEVSSERAEPPCQNFTYCGGCKLMHLPYPQTLNYKRRWLETQLSRAGVEGFPEIETHASPKTTHYRNHVQVHINKEEQRGFYAPYSYRTHPFPEGGCLLFEQHLMDQNFPEELKLERCVRSRLDSHTQSAGVWSLHSKEDKGARFQYSVAYPPGSTTTIQFKSTGFFQTNLAALPEWLSSIENHFKGLYEGLSKPAKINVLELFSGFGFISTMISYGLSNSDPFEFDVLGVDCIPKEEVDVLIENDKLGRPGEFRSRFIENYESRDLTNLEKDVDEWGEAARKFAPQILLMNPPRSGFRPDQMERLFPFLESASGRPIPIIYSSCNAATMARDLAYLTGLGYKIKTMELFDFFPWTSHYEVLAVLG